MTIALRSSSYLTNTGTSINFGMPAGWQIGDLLVVSISISKSHYSGSAITITPPAGWTQVDWSYDSRWNGSDYDELDEYMFYRLAQSGDTGPSFSASQSVTWSAATIAAFSGVSQYQPKFSNTKASGNDNTAETGLFVDFYTNGAIISGFGIRQLTSKSLPSGMTLIASDSYDPGGNPGPNAHLVAYAVFTNAIFSSQQYVSNLGASAQWSSVSMIMEAKQAPATPTNLYRLAPESDTTPVFGAYINANEGGKTYKNRYELYQSDGTTLIGTVDTAFGGASGYMEAEYGSTLALGTYKVRASTIDIEGLQSGWTSLLTFQVTTPVTKDSNYLWNVADPTTPVAKDSQLIWNVAENYAQYLNALWVVYAPAIKDFSLVWNVKTAWVTVPETPTIWTGVPEG